MFLIRTAFWLTLVILLLPANKGEQIQILGTAEAAIQDVRTFCVRNPEVCEKSKTAFHGFSEKAQFGAKMLMSFIDDKARGAAEQETVSNPDERKSLFGRETRGTLTDDDLQPNWFSADRKSGV